LNIIKLLGLLTLFSRDWKNIPWYTVASGLFIQYLIALFVLKSALGQAIFGYLSKFIGDFLDFAKSGLAFIIGKDYPANFATGVLPAIVFFCSFIAIVYYYGGMQYLVAKLAWMFVRIMDTSGAESAVACASPFVGQGESALLVGPFVPYMTKSELHSTMVSGFATIAGSVLSFYLTLVKDPKTILCCCIMSIPAGLLLSKIRYPEDEESISKGTVTVPQSEETDVNFLHAATKGSATGMTLIILISGSLLAIVSLYTAADTLVGWLFSMLTITDWIHPDTPVTIELLLSYIFAPVAWLIGIQWSEARLAGELMATKMVVNEFVAYDLLAKSTLSTRSQDLMAFALCGFANFASIGIIVC
jgi:concentrative nucleoside transporter, CNT family